MPGAHHLPLICAMQLYIGGRLTAFSVDKGLLLANGVPPR